MFLQNIKDDQVCLLPYLILSWKFALSNLYIVDLVNYAIIFPSLYMNPLICKQCSHAIHYDPPWFPSITKHVRDHLVWWRHSSRIFYMWPLRCQTHFMDTWSANDLSFVSLNYLPFSIYLLAFLLDDACICVLHANLFHDLQLFPIQIPYLLLSTHPKGGAHKLSQVHLSLWLSWKLSLVPRFF